MSGWMLFVILAVVGFGTYFTGRCYGIEWTLKHLVEGIPIDGDEENRVVKIAVVIKRDSQKSKN